MAYKAALVGAAAAAKDEAVAGPPVGWSVPTDVPPLTHTYKRMLDVLAGYADAECWSLPGAADCGILAGYLRWARWAAARGHMLESSTGLLVWRTGLYRGGADGRPGLPIFCVETYRQGAYAPGHALGEAALCFGGWCLAADLRRVLGARDPPASALASMLTVSTRFLNPYVAVEQDTLGGKKLRGEAARVVSDAVLAARQAAAAAPALCEAGCVLAVPAAGGRALLLAVGALADPGDARLCNQVYRPHALVSRLSILPAARAAGPLPAWLREAAAAHTPHSRLVRPADLLVP